MFSSNMKGQTIVEVVVALSAGIVILSALTLIMTSSLNNANQGSARTLAIQYAQEGLEIVREMKDNDWGDFNALPTNSYCLASTCSTITSTIGSCGPKVTTCSVNVAKSFVREVAIMKNDATCIPANTIAGKTYARAVVSVSYGDGKCTNASNPYCHKVQVESCFTNYDARATP